MESRQRDGLSPIPTVHRQENPLILKGFSYAPYLLRCLRATVKQFHGGSTRHAGRTDIASCPDGIGDPPPHISIARKNIWGELIAQLPEGHLPERRQVLAGDSYRADGQAA